MTDDLTTMMLDSLDKEARRFDRAHPGSETTLYEKAIVPRRRIRRAAEAGVALAVAAAVAVGAHALVQPRSTVEPAESASATAVPLDEREWDPPGRGLVGGAGADLFGSVAVTREEASGCVALDSSSRLDGRPDLGGVPVALGGVAHGEGNVSAVVARDFDSADAAREYLDALTRAASACDGEADGEIGVDAAEVGIQSLAGEGVRVLVSAGDGFGTSWRTWVHVQGSEALAVTAQPGAGEATTADIIIAWFTAASG
ncbi:hypothetical protein QQX10_04430 [Demequina sp. SYSU T00039]|uniref:PknH-like extracellular domain-containing protein n=1 Tax=Demequina lignilytica TaxID=3051663 RepID=A0AAW7M7B1_9MICO|nr:MULTISPECIES: hypothetical protein [unclassified Demequina]MDN4477240.1 hypothetical protein [Demequina sp. SYSU T00039-1]MDN4487413.1 hypothetical protein [Demequina sp. SYSU T00039]MDN4491166.1 hypothetical protein [Demequina sp. SYSU T00068]